MATDIIGALGAGSGVDVKSLAQSLVDVEKMPRESAINTKIDNQERRIAGYSALMLSLETVKTAFQKLNDLSDFNAGTVSNSQPTALSAVTTSAAVPGRHTIEVQRLASSQSDSSTAFSSTTQSLNSGSPFSVRLTLGGDLQNSIRVATPTPQGIVDAINTADQGVTAQLLDTGDASNPYKIVLSGPIGADGAFSFSIDDAAATDSSGNARTGRADTIQFQAATADGTISVGGVSVTVTAGQTAIEVAEAARVALAAADFITGVTGRGITTNGSDASKLDLQWALSDGADPLLVASDTDSTGATVSTTSTVQLAGGNAVAGLDLADANLKTAADALVVVNGLSVTRSANAVDDIIPGVYIDLLATNLNSPADIRITRDTATIKESLQAAVTAYNDAISDMGILTGERTDDEADMYSGSLKGDSTVRRIKSELREMFVGDSSTAGTSLTAFRDLGLDIDRTGVMSLDTTKLDTALTNHFDDVVTLFSANTNSQTELGTANRGIAGDAIKRINDLISTRGTLMTQSEGSQQRIDDYKVKLEALNTRMESLLARYTKQFGIMETMVGQSNAMRDSLKSTFEGMMSMYTNK
ncbi:MAG: flagellar filament capping protein FliD [Burkholderiaceae bacterium]|nr:flagellar filament capping protein FliD [Burkholderiaceae bacterium]